MTTTIQSTNFQSIVNKQIAPKAQLVSNVYATLNKLKSIKGSGKNILTVLDNIHLNNGRVHLSNIGVGAYAILPCIIGEGLVEFDLLLKLISKINKKSALSIQISGNECLIVVDNKIEHTISVNEEIGDYPNPYNEVVSDSIPLFNSTMDYSIFSSFLSKDEMRISMSGVCFTSENNEVKAIATDCHTMRYENVGYTENDFSFIAPKEITKINGECTFFANEKYVSVVADNIGYYFRKIDANFPEYKNVIPANNAYKIDVSAVELYNVIERAKITSGNNTVTLLFSKNGTYKIHSSNIEENLSQSLIEGKCFFEGADDEFVISVNAEKTQQCLKGIIGGIQLQMESSTRAILIGDTMLVMPINSDIEKNNAIEAVSYFANRKPLSFDEIMQKFMTNALNK